MSTKDFQVRHGLVVNNNVLVANVITNRVGIGTANPQHMLDVAGTVNVQTIIINGSNISSDITSSNNYSGNMANAANAYAGSMSNSSNSYAGAMANAANLYTNTVGASANAYSNVQLTTSQDYTNVSTYSANSYGGIMANSSNSYAGSMANSSNAYAVSVGGSVNTYSMMFANSVANSSNLYTNTVGVAANSYSGYMANSANVFTAAAFNVSNAAFLAANSAYNKVNTAATITTGSVAPVNPHEGDLWWNSDAGTLLIWFTDVDSSQWIEAYAGSEVLISDIVYRSYDQSNAAYSQSNTAFDQSNTAILSIGPAFDKANAANLLAYNTGISANSYAGSMANSSNLWSNTVGTAGNNYTIEVGAAANTWANTKIANTSGVTTAGAFNVSGILTTQNALRETKSVIAASNIDLSAGNYFTKTISGTTTFTVSNVPPSGTAVSFILDMTNGGSSTINWWSGVKWASGSAPTLTTSGRDILGFFTHDGGTTWNGIMLGKGMA